MLSRGKGSLETLSFIAIIQYLLSVHHRDSCAHPILQMYIKTIIYSNLVTTNLLFNKEKEKSQILLIRWIYLDMSDTQGLWWLNDTDQKFGGSRHCL